MENALLRSRVEMGEETLTLGYDSERGGFAVV